jgi:hypothetical protein
MVDDTWMAEAHEPIEELNERLWRIQAPLPGLPIQRVMTVARRSDGDLVIHSGVSLDAASMARIEAWGTPAYLVVPNGFHRMGAPAYKARYPDIRVLCPSGARKRVQKAVPVDLTYEDYPQDEAVQLEYLDGVGEREGLMRVRAEDGVTLVLNDVLFNAPHATGLPGFLFRHVTGSTGGPRVSRLFKIAVVKDRAELRRCFEQLAATPDLRRVVVSHHRVIEADPGATLRAVASRL